MREYDWSKPTITPDEIMVGLIKQYGPDQPITVEMEDRNKAIPYKSAMATFECHRCGATFNMTPASVLNSYYTTRYVCMKCGPLNDAQLKAKQKDHMNERALEELEKHGVNVFEETDEEKKAKQEKEEDARVALSSEDYSEAFDDIAESESQESVTPETEAAQDEDYSKYMADDDDDTATIGDFEKKATESAEAVEEAKKAAEAEKAKALEEAAKKAEAEKAKALEEAAKKAAEEKAAMEAKIRAEMEAKMKAELEAERAKANAELEAAKKAQEEAERYAAEAEARAQESEEPADDEISDDDQSEVYEDDPDAEEAVDDEAVPFGISEDEETENSEEEQVEYDQVVGDEGFSNDEFEKRVDEELSALKGELGFQTWSKDSFTTDNEGHILATCRICGLESKLNSFKDISKVVIVGKNFCKAHGLEEKINNEDGSNPIMSSCRCCRESIEMNGYNEYHRNAVERLAKESHFEIVNPDKRWFIPAMNEIFTIRCNGIEKDITFAKLCLFNGKDAREDEMFKVVKSTENVEPAKATEPVKPTVIKPHFDEAATPKQAEPEKIVLKAKAPERKEASGSSTPNQKSSVFKMNPDKPQTMYEKYSNMGPKVENAADTSASLDEERYVEQENIRKHNVFKVGQKMILSNKNVAKLNGRINPFEREEALEDQFRETKMAQFISDLSSESGVKCNLMINNKTYELPVIDFESGLRVICADLDDRSIPNVPFQFLGNPKQLPFTFKENGSPKPFTWTILYSDSVNERRDATFAALMKYINPEVLAYNGKKIRLRDNLDLEYTTYDQFLRDFDVRYSPFPGGKPKTGQLGILARWNSSAKATTKDVLKFQLQVNGVDNVANLSSLEDESSQYMVASIRYIERFNKETNRVIYTITEYVEVGSCLVEDGLKECIRALLKEYQFKYPDKQNVEPYITVECDPNSYTSPTVKAMIDSGELNSMNDLMNGLIYGPSYRPGKGVEQYLRYSYVRRPEYRTKDSDSFRHDMRMFSKGTLIKTMEAEIQQAGIANSIGLPDVRNRFIANMGYVKARQAEIREMFVDQTAVSGLLYDPRTTLMRKHIEADGNAYQNTRMVTDSAAGIGMNNIMTNPNLINQYQRIMNGTPEAQQYMMNLMYQSNPMMAAQMQVFGGMPQNPMMGGMPGMGMNMMGMNPMMGQPNFGN